jgi:hypothetical protein
MRVLSYKGRSIWKGLYFFLKKKNNNIRNIQISKKFLNNTIIIKNGIQEKRIVLKKKNLYTKFGQYFYTKRLGFKIHIKKKKKKNKKIKKKFNK